ncbi:MAG: hypothetical protein CMJ76_01860, partial [Planctomycetaceae bacterium]|nr:hypothetical protein [Planctomycetaceae bacterium]
MFDFFSKQNRKLKSSVNQSSKELVKTIKRSLFLESLEDRRLLAQNVVFSDFEVLSGGVPTAVNSGDTVNIAEGDILQFTGTTIDDGVSADVDIVVELEISTAASAPVGSDFEVDLGSDFSASTLVPFRGLRTIDASVGDAAEFTFQILVTDDTVVELDDDFTVQIFSTAGAAPQE